MKFRCWESIEREEGTAREFESASAQDAAQAWALWRFHRQERDRDYFFEVSVRFGDQVLHFEVDIEVSASAFARPVVHQAAAGGAR